MSDLIISLTTIPPRMNMIQPTLQNLLDQTADVKEIRLNIPRVFRRFPDQDWTLPALPSGITVVRTDLDYGPATKILPTVQAYADQDVDILFCDDDQCYEPDWAQRFLDARKSHPNACIVENGYDLNAEDPSLLQPRAKRRPKDWRYRVARLASGLRKRPSRYVQSGYVDILEGYRGALLRPDSLPSSAFDIPDVLWTVDDVWLSGQLAKAGVPLWLNVYEKTFPKAHAANQIEALLDLTYQNYNRVQADTSCVAYFQKTYGIWNGAKE